MVLYFMTDILIARTLPGDAYGEWTFFYALMTMCFWVVWLGINASTKRYVAISADDRSIQYGNIRAGVFLRVCVSMGFIPILLLLTGVSAGALGYPQKYPHLRSLMLIGCALCFFNSFSEFFKDLFVGLIRFRNIFWMSLVEFGGYLVFGIGLLWLFGTVYALAWGYVASVLLTGALGALLLKKYIAQRFQAIRPAQIGEARRSILRYAMPFFAVSFGALILMEIDTFMIGILRPDAAETGIFAVAKNLSGKATHINLALATSMMTAFAFITPENLRDKKMYFRRVLLINLGVTLLVCLAFLTLGRQAILLIYGGGFEASGIVLWILIPYYFQYSISLFYSILLDYHGKAYTRSLFYYLMVFLDLVLNSMLIPRYGAVGAAAATSISLLPYLIALIWLSRKLFREIEKRA